MKHLKTIKEIVDWLRERIYLIGNSLNNNCQPRPTLLGEDLLFTLSVLANDIETAHKREIESITPKPDPDWKDICAKCMEGEIEPKHCEYYGEPNGCSSPIYGEHPTVEKSSAVGNGAKMREALVKAHIMLKICDWPEGTDMDGVAIMMREIEAALAEPPRNCDRPECATSKAAQDMWRKEAGGKTAYYEWLLALTTEKEGGKDGSHIVQ